MEQMLAALSVILILIILLLILKIYLLKKSAKEIHEAFSQKLTGNTNTLIGITSRDRQMLQLAQALNSQLKLLRTERRRFQQGDLELKEAVANISHDLRTPLTAICGYLELLSQEELSPNAQRYLDMVKNRTQVLKQLTEELFGYSIAASVKEESRTMLSLNRMLEESLASYYGALTQKKISPVISFPDEPVKRNLDPSSLTRIFANILSNVLKYSDGDLGVALTPDGCITFSNTAKNLTPIMAARLFDRFYTVETGQSATGLGLSIAKLLTERMGGSIAADYRQQTLYITLHFPSS